jgi:hypothetical protein
MPKIFSTYSPPLLFKSAHFNTIYKTLFFNNEIHYQRKRIETPDADFIDLDFLTTSSDTLVIAMHGLEGSSKSKYIVSICNFLNSQKIDCVAVNFRGCSGEDNRFLQSYHSGKTDDLDFIISYILNSYNYQKIILLGYSMGGNITLKYLGETENIPSEIKGVIAISVPCDLEGSSNALSQWKNKIYMNRFLKTLKEKSLTKLEKFPESNLNRNAILNATNFQEFDDVVTAPLFGFKNAKDYWTQNSAKPFLTSIKKPTLIISALDDTFLSKSCYPFDEAEKNVKLYLETPSYGGHVGFNTVVYGKDKLWSEKRVFDFIQNIIL